MIALTYQEETSEVNFLSLAQALGEWDGQKTVKLYDSIGSGTIDVLNIEKGLEIRIWDCTLHTELPIYRKSSTLGSERTFTLTYFLSQSAIQLNETAHTSYCTIDRLWNTSFVSNDVDFNIIIEGGKEVRFISLCFTYEWLLQNILCEDEINNSFFRNKVDSNNPFAIFESFGTNEGHLLKTIFQNKQSQSFGKFFFRSKTLNLLTDFFVKIANRSSTRQGTTMFHEEQINLAEKKIAENISNVFPDMKKIATELSISESTLKRYFKRIHGKNTYAYFLEKKMEHAAQLLKDNEHTVSETAFLLGYERTSQFIAVFKKHYGVRPGASKSLAQS